MFFMGSPRGVRARGRYFTPYFWPRIHFTSAFTSASGTAVLGGIGTLPHTPWLPFLTFSASFAGAALSARYFAATSLYDGPTIFLSTVWQARQACFFASSSLACAGHAASKPRIRTACFMGSP